MHFILVEPKEAGNIGASARALKNMGFKNLGLVKPVSFVSDEALWFAHNAAEVLESAKVFDSVRDAISDKSIVAGTSRRTGRQRGIFINAEQGAQRLFNIAAKNKVAILFGREDRGLFNDEIEECGFMMTIPANKKHPSLNLAQAVMIIAYELSKAGPCTEGGETLSLPAFRLPKLTDQNELLHLYKRIENILAMLEYSSRGDRNLRNKIMQNLKHCFGRTGLTEWELKMFHGICSRIEKKKQARSLK